MKKTYVILAVILLPIVLMSTVSCTGNTMRKTNPAIEKRIDNIIDQMTFDEKIAYLGGTGLVSGEKIGETVGIERIGLPVFKMTDATMGSVMTKIQARLLSMSGVRAPIPAISAA